MTALKIVPIAAQQDRYVFTYTTCERGPSGYREMVNYTMTAKDAAERDIIAELIMADVEVRLANVTDVVNLQRRAVK